MIVWLKEALFVPVQLYPYYCNLASIAITLIYWQVCPSLIFPIKFPNPVGTNSYQGTQVLASV